MVEFKDDRAASHACSKLWCHISQKGLEGGSVIGTFLVAPSLAAYDVLANKKSIKDVDPLKLLAGVAYSAAGALGLTFLVGSIKIAQMDLEGMKDRAYRLYYNQGQHRNDHFAQAGSALGLAAAAYFLRERSDAKPLHYGGAAAAGAAAGVVLHVLTRPAEQKTANKMIHELKY